MDGSILVTRNFLEHAQNEAFCNFHEPPRKMTRKWRLFLPEFNFSPEGHYFIHIQGVKKVPPGPAGCRYGCTVLIIVRHTVPYLVTCCFKHMLIAIATGK